MSKKIIISLLIFSFLIAVKEASAFGISPPGVREKNLKPADKKECVVYLMRNQEQAASEEKYSVVASGSGAEFLSLPAEITLPEGETEQEFKFSIDPTEYAGGDYQASIEFNASSKNEEKANNQEISISTNAAVSVSFSVDNPNKLILTDNKNTNVTDDQQQNPAPKTNIPAIKKYNFLYLRLAVLAAVIFFILYMKFIKKEKKEEKKKIKRNRNKEETS